MAVQTLGQQKRLAGDKTIGYSQDIAAAIRQAVATHPARFSQFALVTIEFHFAVVNKQRCGYGDEQRRGYADEQSTLCLLNAMRAHTRQKDLAWLKDTTCYFLLANANLEGGETMQQRLWKTLVESIQIMQENALMLPCTMTIGYSAYPEPSATIEQCLDDARIPYKMRRDEYATQVSPAVPKEDLSMMAREMGVPYLAFLPRTLPRKVKRLVGPELAQELRCFPLGCADRTLTVAMSDPQDGRVLDRLRKETGMQIFPVLIHPDELSNALEHITR